MKERRDKEVGWEGMMFGKSGLVRRKVVLQSVCTLFVSPDAPNDVAV